MAKKITPEEIEEMKRLYLQIGTYSGVAKAVGRAASTVKKYVEGATAQSIATSVELEPIDWSFTHELEPIDLNDPHLCELKEGEFRNEG